MASNQVDHLVVGDKVEVITMTVSSDTGRNYVHVGDVGVVEKVYGDGQIKVVSNDEVKWRYIVNFPHNFKKI